ncbi:MAG: arginine--tRNA ligase [Acidaminococcus provencensis]|jgi:arginyl-tRNA synthetase|nr:arginine--tRNA ligase [Acidaminococcus provencensis]MCH4097520.1 arginine--tRNA ligase [Acidaminococcus provencensis]
MKKVLAEAVIAAVQKAIQAGKLPQGDLVPVVLTVPPQKAFGDFATNFALQAARNLHCAPRVIAGAIQEFLDCPSVEKVEVAGPGFLNFFLKEDWLSAALRNILAQGENYGNLPAKAGEKIQIEYVSANPTGPLHVGHGRGAAVGSALAILMKAAGYDVSQEYYINDAGNQMHNLAASVNARYLELYNIPCEFPENGYHGEDIVVTAKRIQKKYGDSFIHMPEAERLEKFQSIAKDEKLAALREDLEAFNCHFDVWFSEQSLHDAHKIEEAVAELEKKGYIYEKDGAKWFRSTDFGDDKDRVVIRDNGVSTYFAADIAYHRNKYERGFDRLINLWGADHHGYIPRVKAAMQALGYDPSHLEILILQMVSLYRNGELVKMSKRTGKSVTLNELIEEVGTDAARFFFIMRSMDSQLDFDLTLATEHSNDNPVYYVQYAHARICSILRQMADEKITLDPNADLSVLKEPIEIDLIKKLNDYTELIDTAALERAPHKIAHYTYELAGMFHSFYNQCRVLGVDPALQQARLALITAVGNTLRHGLKILGVSAPEHM